MKKNNTFKYIIAAVLIAFALISIFMSSAVLIDWFGIRAKQGNYVPFIVKTNLTAGFLYLIAAYGLIKSRKWSFWIMLFSSASSILRIRLILYSYSFRRAL